MNRLNKQKPELLAPVGQIDAMYAAVANGADAIYVGGPAFGARKEAAFTHDELVEIVEFCHLHQVRVYVTINTTVFDDEINEITNYIHFLYVNSVDAVIVCDLGVAKLVQHLYPDFEMHLSTQMNLHNNQALEFAKTIGASRIVAARENSLEEIEKMCQTDLEIEVFVHGALCFCYSGQCLMSSIIGGRSGNRGACAQPCRLSYRLINLATNETLNSEIGNYLLSPRDLKTVDDIGALIERGVTSFKIEGRLKKAEYVATVVKAYRLAIDQYFETSQINLEQKLHDDLDQVFSRTFTKGFLHGEKSRDWIGARRSGHRGIPIGKVIMATGNRATVKLNATLNLHDGVRFIGTREAGMEVQKMFVNGDDVKIATLGLVDLICNFTPEKGMKVFKTASSTLAKAVEVEKIPKIPIHGEIKMCIGEPLKLTVWDASGNTVSLLSEEKVQLATNSGLDEDRLHQQLSKTGSTPFEVAHLSLQTEALSTIPISTINQLRRDALSELEIKRRNWHQDRIFSEIEIEAPVATTVVQNPELLISVCNFEQLQAVCKMAEVEKIYYKDFATLPKAVELARKFGKKMIPVVPRIVDDIQIGGVVKQLKELELTTVLVGEYGALGALRRDFEVLTDFSFNTNNALSLGLLADLGVVASTISYELSGSQIRKLAKYSPLPLEAVVFTRIPLMITKHCLLKAHYQQASTCLGKYCQIPHGLRDRKGKILPLIKVGKCHTEILNHEHLILLEKLGILIDAGVSRFRLEFTTETPAEIQGVVKTFHAALNNGTIDHAWLQKYNYTICHFNRGIQ